MKNVMAFALTAALASVVSGKAIDADEKGYVVNKANGLGYRLMYQARPWREAQETCVKNGGKLAVPKSEEEFAFVQQVVRGMAFKNVSDGDDYRLLVWVGVSNLDQLTQWRTVDGEDIKSTGFSRFAGGGTGAMFSDSPKEPHCVGIDAINDGYRDFWCQRYQPYVCQKNM